MSDRELNILFRSMARRGGLCDEWYSSWSDDDTLDMCLDRFVRGIDFSIGNTWLDLDIVREHLSLDLLHRHHVYLDEDVELECGNGRYVFLGSCRGVVVFGGFTVGDVYIFGTCDVRVIVRDFARVHVSHYDDSRVFLVNEGNGRGKLMDRCRKPKG